MLIKHVNLFLVCLKKKPKTSIKLQITLVYDEKKVHNSSLGISHGVCTMHLNRHPVVCTVE